MWEFGQGQKKSSGLLYVHEVPCCGKVAHPQDGMLLWSNNLPSKGRQCEIGRHTDPHGVEQPGNQYRETRFRGGEAQQALGVLSDRVVGKGRARVGFGGGLRGCGDVSVFGSGPN